MKCKNCKNEMVTDDYGYYCSNTKCKEFDKTKLAYEEEK